MVLPLQLPEMVHEDGGRGEEVGLVRARLGLGWGQG